MDYEDGATVERVRELLRFAGCARVRTAEPIEWWEAGDGRRLLVARDGVLVELIAGVRHPYALKDVGADGVVDAVRRWLDGEA